MTEPLIFSSSAISSYIACKKMYELGYERLLEAKAGDEGAMGKGTAFHKWAQYMTTKIHSNLAPVDAPEVSDQVKEVYHNWWNYRGSDKNDKKKRVLGVESPIYTPLDVNTGVPDQKCYLRCTFDEIYLDKNDWIVGFDYKTFSVHTPWDVDLDFQGRIYVAALQQLFPTYNVRFEYERIRQSAPGTPRGEAQNLRLEEGTWWQYNKAGDKRKRAELWKPEECYETIDLVPSTVELETLWDETKFNVMELLVRRKAAQTMPGAWGRSTNKFQCKMCYMKDLCKADLQDILDEQTIGILANRRTPLEIPPELQEQTDDVAV